jgi:hypothetical protein
VKVEKIVSAPHPFYHMKHPKKALALNMTNLSKLNDMPETSFRGNKRQLLYAEC